MKTLFFVTSILFVNFAFGQSNVTELGTSPWASGYSMKLEGEIETDRNKKGEIKGYESEIDLQIRKKLSKSLSLFVGAEVEGAQEKSEAAYYNLHEASFGVRKKYKLGQWKLKTQAAFRYYADHEYRKKKGIDGALFLRARFKRNLLKSWKLRLRSRFYEYVRTTGEKDTRERRIRLEARPSYRLGVFELGTIQRLTYTREIGNDRSVLDLGPIARWNIKKGIQLTFITEYRPWDTQVPGKTVPLFETKPVHSLELEIKI